MENKYHVLICGGRTELNYAIVSDFITSIINSLGIEDCEVVSGGCRGADLSGERFARDHNYEIKRFLPDWKRLGRSAGIKRNAEMINYIKQFEKSIVIAFWNGESHGTKFTIEQAKKNNIPVYICYYSNTDPGEDVIKTEVKLQKPDHTLYYSAYTIKPEQRTKNKYTAPPDKITYKDKLEHLINVSLKDLTGDLEKLDCVISTGEYNEINVPVWFFIKEHYSCKGIALLNGDASDLDIDTLKNFHNVLIVDAADLDSSTVSNFLTALDNADFTGEARIFFLNIQ